MCKIVWEPKWKLTSTYEHKKAQVFLSLDSNNHVMFHSLNQIKHSYFLIESFLLSQMAERVVAEWL